MVALIRTFSAFSLLLIPPSNAQTPIESLDAAAEIVKDITAAGTTLLKGETVQLTNGVIKRLESDGATANISSLFSFAAKATDVKRPTPQCKTFPGDDLWPADAIWKPFNSLLGNSLIKTVPIAAPCYDSEWGPKNQAKCNSIVDGFNKPPTHENDPTSIFWPIFQGKTCMAVNTTTSEDKCTLGGYPAYAVNISTVAKVQLAVNFARTTDIRLVVKNTGHDFLVKSTGAGSLSIWTNNLKDIKFLSNYEYDGYTGKAFKVGAGVTVEEIYRAAEAQKTTVQGGISPSVGFAGGYLQGGGHNPLSGYNGMAKILWDAV